MAQARLGDTAHSDMADGPCWFVRCVGALNVMMLKEGLRSRVPSSPPAGVAL